MAKIFMTVVGGRSREIQISNDITRIGRERMNHIQIDHLEVSRFHAEIHRQGLCYSIVDKQSTNGTYLNDKEIAQESPLNHNDRIVIGNCRMIFVLEKSDLPEILTPNSFTSRETIQSMARKASLPITD